MAEHFDNDSNIVHVASRKTGLDISDENAVHSYFESIGTIEHFADEINALNK
ncbi:hypothetical protein [Moritella sp. Urea-trap-13]|uniref:hypothetical protein n=1 Tax=Moritella sp. Urea-trap-13 TaxID=2058327 RepID=UPI0018E3B2D4|nr:hypothetical protein [Moritella sp. Urea-trap-13]